MESIYYQVVAVVISINDILKCMRLIYYNITIYMRYKFIVIYFVLITYSSLIKSMFVFYL